ncbi:hypothetical protein [Cupriavidus pauculus]|uniref:hypothetical protein n=1 Tax=Cupriavidus pauculus TaxID=82633 RepID=UPI001FD40E3F|nr:hypothetical protein [Cupriavidus pauculus]
MADKYLGSWLEWGENDSTNQLFDAFAFVHPASTAEFLEMGSAFGRWIAAAGVPGILGRCIEPDHLARLDCDGNVFVSSRPRADLN